MELIETCFLTSIVVYHKSVPLGGNTERFTRVANLAFLKPEFHFGNSGFFLTPLVCFGNPKKPDKICFFLPFFSRKGLALQKLVRAAYSLQISPEKSL